MADEDNQWMPVSSLSAEDQQALAPAQDSSIDPVESLDPAQLFELSVQTKGGFDPLAWGQANPDRATDPAISAKLADTHARIKERGFQPADLPGVEEFSKGEIVKGLEAVAKPVGSFVKGAAKQVFNYGSLLTEPIVSLVGYATGQGPEFQTELAKPNERRAIETGAGLEAAGKGLTDIPGKVVGSLGHLAGVKTGLVSQYQNRTPEEKLSDFFADLGKAQQASEISKGQGTFTTGIGGETVKELAAAGTPVRETEINDLTAGDPLSFLVFGKAFGAVGGALAKAAPAVAAAENIAGNVVAKVGGRAIQSAGKIAEFGGQAAKVGSKALPIISAVKGGTLAGGPGVIGGLAAGGVAGRVVKNLGGELAKVGESVAGAGKQIAGAAEITSPYVQAARDALAAAPILASETLKGAAFDVGLAAATSETPQDTQAAAALGTVLGGLKGIGRAGAKLVQGQIVTPRPWGTEKSMPAYGNFANLDNLHSQAATAAAPGQVLRANAIRQFLKGSGDQVQAYLMPDAVSMEKALIDRGVSPETAKAAAQSQGMFTGDILDDAGRPRRVVLLNNADAAPHEAFHGIQDVLGEQANSVIDGLVYQEYAPQWENLGQQYAGRLGAEPGGDWRGTVLDKSGWGNAAAAEKAMRDAGNKLQAETGAEPRPADAKALAEGVLSKARESGAGWREILSPEEAASEANRYLARELAAENFDVAFKRLGAGLTEGTSLPEKLARIVAKTANFFGVEPLSGARSEGLGIEPRQKVGEAVTDLGKSLKIEPKAAPEAARPTVRAKGSEAAPVTPEQRSAEGQRVNTLADEVVARNPQTAEVLRKIANAISTGVGLKVDYRAAAGEPAGNPGSSRPERRAAVEAFRNMPESVRPLWEKLNFPDRVVATKNKGFQVLGWSPENYAANANKLAAFIANVQAKVPEARNWSPYQIDPVTKSFTADAWKQLYDDAQTFVQNQQSGGTGSGRALKLPENAAALGVSVPPLETSKLKPLSQNFADFHNILFNVMLPETVRVSRKGGTPGNIVGQDIAKANEPLIGRRVVEPGRARGVNKETGQPNEFAGFEGRRIMEVNPLRAEFEKAAKVTGIEYPSLVEVNQRLNLEHVADVTAVPEAPAIRGVTDTLRAGFLPDEIAGKSAKEISEKILNSKPEEFAAITTGFKSKKLGGGLTGLAAELGSKIASPAELADYAEAWRSLPAKLDAARAAKDLDTMFSIPTKQQFFRELLEAATDGTTAEFIRKRIDPDFVSPFPKAQYSPRTESAKAFEKDGYEFVTSGIPGYRSVSVRKSGTEIGEILASGNISDVVVNNAFLEKAERGKGLGEALYREMLSQLQLDGVKQVSGRVVAPEPLALREKIFGEGSTKVDLNFEPATIEQALRAAEDIGKRGPGGELQVAAIEARNEISPTAQFAPKDESKFLPAGPEGVSKAWILPSGKIEQLGGQWHHHWLSDNPEVAKKYNLDVPAFEGNDTEGVRESALKKGFVRVNYQRNTGTLTVEARSKDWRKQKAAVEKMVERNLDDIDNVSIHLLNESATKVADSDSARLFQFDTDAEKLANIPFITKGESRAQFSPSGEKPFLSETFDEQLKQIKSGSIGGQTFNPDGTVWTPDAAKPVDVVTLASVNLPLGSINREAVVKALGPYEELLSEPGVAAGVFAFSKEGRPVVSVDINALVPQKYRENSVKFGSDNDQVSIWDSAKSKEVKTGGKGNTRLNSVDQILSALDELQRGKPVDVENIVAQSEAGPTSESQNLPGFDSGKEYNQSAISQFTRVELERHFPEAVVPRRSNETIDSNITGSPLAKAAGSREAAVSAFARKLAEFYREHEDSPELQAGTKWYSEFTPMLKREFGADSRIFAELLAATSPNTEPGVNFGFAFDALQNLKAGKYDKLVTKFNEGLDKLADGSLKSVYDRDNAAGKVNNAPENPSDATYLAHWVAKHKLLPVGTGGKRFGMHSFPVLKVFARKWLKLNSGPKTDNFVKNLLGEGDEATIDVWADRTMRRVGYAGSKERWRILPRNKTGVSDEDFAFSQAAFREAADELGIKPSALQGALWFVEKSLWHRNGWGRLDLGDFRKEVEKLPLLRAGYAQRQKALKVSKSRPAAEQSEFGLIEPKIKKSK